MCIWKQRKINAKKGINSRPTTARQTGHFPGDFPGNMAFFRCCETGKFALKKVRSQLAINEAPEAIPATLVGLSRFHICTQHLDVPRETKRGNHG